MSGWTTRSTRTIYENQWIRVREDEVTRPDGSPGVYGVVEVRQPAAFVVPVTEAGEVVLVRLHRYTVGRDSLEVPAGGTDGEDLLVAARRELREEAGLEAGSVRELGLVHSLNGVSDAPGHVVLAEQLTPVTGEEHERAKEGITEVVALPWPDVLDRIRAGEIHDGETIAALMHAAIALGRVS